MQAISKNYSAFILQCRLEYTLYYSDGTEQKIHFYKESEEVSLEEREKPEDDISNFVYEPFKAIDQKFELKCNDKDIVFIVTKNENGTVNLEVQYDERKEEFKNLTPITDINPVFPEVNGLFNISGGDEDRIFDINHFKLISTTSSSNCVMDENQIIYLSNDYPSRSFIYNRKIDSEKPFALLDNEDIEITAVQKFDEYYLVLYIENFLKKAALKNIETSKVENFPEEVAEYDLNSDLLYIREKDSILLSYYRPKSKECLLDFLRTRKYEDNLSLILSQSRLGLPADLTKNPIVEKVESFDRNYNIPVFIWEPHERPIGTIVFVHGGPWSHEGYERCSLLNPLIEMRYKVIVPELIGSTGNGYKYSELGMNEASLGKKLQDLKKVLEKHYEGEKLVVIGHSYGAYLVNCAAVGLKDTKGFSNYISRFISLAGIWNVCTFFENSEIHVLGKDCLIKKFQIGTNPWEENVNEKISPIFHLNEISVPLTIVHGVNDKIVPVNQAKLVEKLIDAISNVKIITIEGEGHRFSKTEQGRNFFKM